MVKKGIISNFDIVLRTAEVIIPELDNVVTPMIPIAYGISITSAAISQNCIVAFFSDNFADGAVIAII